MLKEPLIRNYGEAWYKKLESELASGIYDEVLNINKSELRLVGLGNSTSERVVLNNQVIGNDVEIFNVEC